MVLGVGRGSTNKTIVACAILAILVCGVLAGCSRDGAYYVSVSELLADPDTVGVDTVKAGGVFVEAPVTTASGTIFTIADSLDSDERLNVYSPDTQPLGSEQGLIAVPGELFLGTEVVVSGSYDGQVLTATDIIIKYGSGHPGSETTTQAP